MKPHFVVVSQGARAFQLAVIRLVNMIQHTEQLTEFEAAQTKAIYAQLPQKSRIIEAPYHETDALGVIPLKDPLDGIETDFMHACESWFGSCTELQRTAELFFAQVPRLCLHHYNSRQPNELLLLTDKFCPKPDTGRIFLRE